MKKLVVLMMTMTMLLSMIGCSAKKENEEAPSVEVQDALEILTAAWAGYDESVKFSVNGGGYSNMVMDEPGVIDPADTESLTGLLSFPADNTDMIDDAASMMHAMNANTFTAAAYHAAEAADQQTLADVLKDSIMNTQWICGFPEVMLIAGVGDDYLVTCIGNTALVEEFEAQLAAVYGDSVVVFYEENLV